MPWNHAANPASDFQQGLRRQLGVCDLVMVDGPLKLSPCHPVGGLHDSFAVGVGKTHVREEVVVLAEGSYHLFPLRIVPRPRPVEPKLPSP
jgi:hypothetical protein